MRAAIGEYNEAAATSPRTPPDKRRAYWQKARAEYAQALSTWAELARQKPLEGDAAEDHAQLEAAIARCDKAIASPGPERPSP